MKRLATVMVVFLFVTGVSFAQGMMQQRQGQMGQQRQGQMGMMGKGMMGKGMMGMQGGMMGGMHSMMYSMMVHHALMRAQSLNLTDNQRNRLANVREKFVYPVVRKEADFKISHMKIMDMLHNPNFDPARLKAEIKTSNQLNLEMANTAVEGLSTIRNIIGIENYRKITQMMPMMGGRMMQGGIKQSGPTMEKDEPTQKAPVQEKKENPSGEL